MDPVTRALVVLNAAGAVCAETLDSLAEEDINPAELVEGGGSLWTEKGIIPSAQAIMTEWLSNDGPEREMQQCLKKGVRIVARGDKEYPTQLEEIPEPPLVLYVRGDGFPSRDSVAMVGTRRRTPYGARCAERVGALLAGTGRCVVSGGALGIDGSAHRGCLDGGGKTVAVLGTGIDMVYPERHRNLFEEITASGALVSEFPLGSSGVPWHFPRRNRIIAGLSNRLVVVEAPWKSGAMTTARFAADAGREIWAVPGRITESACRGSNGLIADGALVLVDENEFARIVSGRQMQLFENESTCVDYAKGLSDGESRVLAILREQGDRSVDNIATESTMSAADILSALTMLSANGLVHSSGGRWSASSLK
ncbi:MAG: DNA-processing protein DprA [Synergistota bacterium]|nr:DNA-processing protein DprA [Synergistota bacterium]